MTHFRLKTGNRPTRMVDASFDAEYPSYPMVGLVSDLLNFNFRFYRQQTVSKPEVDESCFWPNYMKWNFEPTFEICQSWYIRLNLYLTFADFRYDGSSRRCCLSRLSCCCTGCCLFTSPRIRIFWFCSPVVSCIRFFSDIAHYWTAYFFPTWTENIASRLNLNL